MFSKLVFATLLLNAIPGEALKAIYTPSKLPTMYGRSVAAAFVNPHDPDSFFIILSSPPPPDPRPPNVILNFNAGSETDAISEFMPILPDGQWTSHHIAPGDNIVMDTEGNFYLVGVYNAWFGYTNVLKIDPVENTTTNWRLLPYSVQKSSSVKAIGGNGDEVFIIESGSEANRVLKLNLRTNTASHVTNLGNSINPDSSIVWGNNQTLIFGSLVYYYGYHHLQRLDLNTWENRVTNETIFGGQQRHNSYPNAVYDGSKYVYVIGGVDQTSEYGTIGLLKLDPETMEQTWIPVEDFPINAENYFYRSPQPLFDAVRNRIYFFGGMSRNSSDIVTAYHDDIWYVELKEEQK